MGALRISFFFVCTVWLVVVVHSASISEKYTALKSPHSFSKIMTQLESMIQARSPVEDIYRLYYNFVGEINAEQSSQNLLHEHQLKECEDEFDFRNVEVTSATEAVAKSTIVLSGCTAQKERSDQDYANTSQQISETEGYLDNLISSRKAEAVLFERQTEAYNANSEAVYDALSILEQIWSGEATFIELANHTNSMLKYAIAIKKVNKLAPVMAALAQLANKKLIADTHLLGEVQKLLRNFRDTIEADYLELEQAEQQAISLFVDVRGRTEEFLASLKQAKAGLEIEQAKLTQCLSVQTSILTTAHAKLQRNQGLLNSAIKMCESFDKEYKSASEARKQELELIEVIKQKIVEKYGQISDSVKERLQQDNFNPHVNENKYEAVGAHSGSQDQLLAFNQRRAK